MEYMKLFAAFVVGHILCLCVSGDYNYRKNFHDRRLWFALPSSLVTRGNIFSIKLAIATNAGALLIVLYLLGCNLLKVSPVNCRILAALHIIEIFGCFGFFTFEYERYVIAQQRGGGRHFFSRIFALFELGISIICGVGFVWFFFMAFIKK